MERSITVSGGRENTGGPEETLTDRGEGGPGRSRPGSGGVARRLAPRTRGGDVAVVAPPLLGSTSVHVRVAPGLPLGPAVQAGLQEVGTRRAEGRPVGPRAPRPTPLGSWPGLGRGRTYHLRTRRK